MALNRLIRSLDFTSYVMLLLLVGQVICFVWALDRGFDFTDEAYSYLGFANPEEITNVATYYAVFVNKFFGWIGIDIIRIRIIRLILLIGCGLAFGLGLSKWLRKNSTLTEVQHNNLVLFILAGSFLVNASGSQALTYNISTTFLLQTIVGFVLYLDQREFKTSAVDKFCFSIVGAMLFVLFAVKFSVAILLAFALVIMLYLGRRSAKVLLVHSVMVLLGGIFAGLILFGGDLAGWLVTYKDTLSFAGGLSFNALLARYIEDFYFTTSSKIVANSAAIIIIVSLLLISRRVHRKTVSIIAATAIGLAIIQVTLDRDFYLGGPKHYYTFTGLYIMLGFALVCSEGLSVIVRYIRKEPFSTIHYRVVVLLFAIPLIGSFGTGNLLSIQIIWYTSFILAGLSLLLIDYAKPVTMIMLIAASINGSTEAVSGLIWYPYRINHALFEETASLAPTPRGESVRVNNSLKMSVDSLITLVQSKTRYSAGDPVFSFSQDYYGFIYLLKGVLPGWGWYDEKGTLLNCNTLSHSAIATNKMIILSPSYYQMDSLYRQCFTKLQINLPGDYENIGTVPYFMGELDRSLNVYAPKSLLK